MCDITETLQPCVMDTLSNITGVDLDCHIPRWGGLWIFGQVCEDCLNVGDPGFGPSKMSRILP